MCIGKNELLKRIDKKQFYDKSSVQTTLVKAVTILATMILLRAFFAPHMVLLHPMTLLVYYFVENIFLK